MKEQPLRFETTHKIIKEKGNGFVLEALPLAKAAGEGYETLTRLECPPTLILAWEFSECTSSKSVPFEMKERAFTLAEIRRNNEVTDSTWIEVSGRVYDVTELTKTREGRLLVFSVTGAEAEYTYDTFGEDVASAQIDELLPYAIGHVTDVRPAHTRS